MMQNNSVDEEDQWLSPRPMPKMKHKCGKTYPHSVENHREVIFVGQHFPLREAIDQGRFC